MNSNPSHTPPFPASDDQPVRIRDYAIASALVVAACGGIAITFTAIAAAHAADAVFQRIFRKGGRHVP